ncbi:MAG TPA: 2-amino-4-hydroxy-6-hydroxymethyldihydropteridine diphosphokinase [Chloroflexota bacterium]
MTVPILVLVGLGSNLGDRAAALASALQLLAAAPGVEVVRLSAVYETDPWGVRDQPVFLNQVTELATTLGPVQLLLLLLTIERELGRERTIHWGPRRIDLDLLDYGGQSIDRPGLTVPHPLIPQRAFVLEPLRELRPDYRLPSGTTIDRALAELGESRSVRRLGSAPAGPPVRVDNESGFL